MLYTGPWGSVHFFPLCFLYWIISINLSLSSLTLLCHSFLLLSPHRHSYKCPSISPHEGQRVKQDMNLNSNRESCLQVFWYLALVALCQQKNIHAKMTVGKNGSSKFCRLIKHTHTYIHTHTHNWWVATYLTHTLSWLFAPGGCMGWHQTQIAPVPAFIFLSVHPGSCHYSCEKDGQVGLP